MNEFVFKNQKKLRCGLTTGTCAAACAQAAMLRLLTGQVRSEVTVRLPESRKRVQVVGSAESDARSSEQRVTLAVYPTADGGFATRKDAGDDPDVTNGTEIRAYIQVCERVPSRVFASADGRLYLTGGEGVGRVTKPGLEQAVGQSAINRVPRQMIFDAVQQVLDAFEEDACTTRYLITISVPAGAELAQRTFNSMLGIEGGISILGTTGIVEPMSEAAIVATIETSIRQVLALEDDAASDTETLRKEDVSADQKAETSEERTAADAAVGQLQSPAAHGEQTEATGSGRKDDGDIGRSARRILAVPGNYGQRYVEQQLGLRGVPVVEMSNYIGEAIDLAVSYGATDFLLVGNVGKLVKLAAGIMNTHSRVADGRWEIFAAHLALCGGTRAQVAAMREATTTEEMLTRLEEMGLRAPVMASIMGEIEAHMAHRIRGLMNFGVIVYSERFGRVGETAGAARLLERFQR